MDAGCLGVSACQLRFAAMALGMAVAISSPAAAVEVPYRGIAALCAVEPPHRTDQLGEITLTIAMAMTFRIETDHELINGTERLESNSRLDATGEGYYWGYGTVVPDSGGGTLEGEFFFWSREMGSITGTYYGTGDLAGVIMTYQLTPTEPPQGNRLCDGSPAMGGYLISGTVENYVAR
jgi:hypothetical protein